MTKGAADSTLVAKYNDLESVKALFDANKGEISGVILEPVVGNSGFIVPDQAFLEGLRELTKKCGTPAQPACAPTPPQPPSSPLHAQRAQPTQTRAWQLGRGTMKRAPVSANGTDDLIFTESLQ